MRFAADATGSSACTKEKIIECLRRLPVAADGAFECIASLAHKLIDTARGWLGSRVVSVLDSGAEGRGFKSQPRRCRVTNSLRHTVHTHRASVHQAAKLVAALLMVAGVTAGLAESNGSLPPGL